jgi:hypothetical protein
MNMQVHHSLTCCVAVVDPDVEPRWIMTTAQFVPAPIQQREELAPFLLRGLEKGSDMALGDDERVAGRDRVSIRKGEAKMAAL